MGLSNLEARAVAQPAQARLEPAQRVLASQSLIPSRPSTKCSGRAGEEKMAATSPSSSPSKVTTAKLGGLSKSSSAYTQLTFCSRHPFQKIGTATAQYKPQPELLLLPRNKHAGTCLATDNDRAAPVESQETTTKPLPVTSGNNNYRQQPQPGANGSPPAPSELPKRVRAARVLGKYAEPGGGPRSSGKQGSSSSKPEFGSRVLDALRETDSGKKGGRKRSGLPEAPSNMLDDSKRGLPKDGWTFDWLAALPVGTDVLVVAASFGLITTVMFGTTYLVWKLGAIHFNEY